MNINNNNIDIINNDIQYNYINDEINNNNRNNTKILYIQNQKYIFLDKIIYLIIILNDIRQIISLANINNIKAKEHFILFLSKAHDILLNHNNYDLIKNISLDSIAYSLTYIGGTLKKFMYAFNMQIEYEEYGLKNMFKYI